MMTKTEKEQLEKHLKAINEAQSFFREMEEKYEEEGLDGTPVGPFGDAGELLAQIYEGDFAGL